MSHIHSIDTMRKQGKCSQFLDFEKKLIDIQFSIVNKEIVKWHISFS